MKQKETKKETNNNEWKQKKKRRRKKKIYNVEITVETSRKEKKGVVNKWEKNRERATLVRNEKNIKDKRCENLKNEQRKNRNSRR